MNVEKEKFRVGNVFISNTTPSDAHKKITQFAFKRQGGYVCVSNIRMVRYAGMHPEYKKLMDESLMNLPDGTPLTWCGKLWGLKKITCTNGPSLFKSMLAYGDRNVKHYLLGDTQDILSKIMSINDNLYHANIVGAEELPFTTVENFDYKNIAKRITESGCNIVWTAMRAPKQDEFNRVLCSYLSDIPCIGVGRAFRMLTGEVRQAPHWAQKMGITGIFNRRKSLVVTLTWYFKSSFVLASYLIRIMWRRATGRRCDE